MSGGGDLDNSQRIEGGTDGTMIGNEGDRLKVTAIPGVGAISTSPKLRAVYSNTEQNITGAAYVSFYSYSGTGYFWAFRVNTDSDGAQLQLTIDGNVIFNGITSKQLSDLGTNGVVESFHHRSGAGTYYFYLPVPISFSSSVDIAAKRDNNGAVKVQERIIYISQET
jgi:hypothetical protein